jgi:hypothetical protein
MPRQIDVTPFGPSARLKPPKTMSEAGRQVFLDLVLGSKAEHFQATDLPLLVRYSEASAMAERAEAEMARQPLVEGKANPWVGIHGQMTKAMQGLSMRLRLSPQARAPNNPTRPERPLSVYDRMDLERQNEDSAQ